MSLVWSCIRNLFFMISITLWKTCCSSTLFTESLILSYFRLLFFFRIVIVPRKTYSSDMLIIGSFTFSYIWDLYFFFSIMPRMTFTAML